MSTQPASALPHAGSIRPTHAIAAAARLGVCAALLAALLGGLSAAGPWSIARAQDRAELPQRIALAPGEYLWMPELAPQGPLLVLVSLPEQLAYVYRNGVRIGVSTVSTGRPGYETPTGVFTILEKRREHYSNLYDNAPMPFMQRLTWDGVALHAGALPGYPASHGCVRLPRVFAEKLFAVTRSGSTVVIAHRAAPLAGGIEPGLSAPLDPAGRPAVATASDSGWTLMPVSPGPLTVIASLGDRRVVVLRDGVEIGRAPLQVRDEAAARALRGTHLYLMLDDPKPGLPAQAGGETGGSLLDPARPARRWQSLTVAALVPGEGDVRALTASGAIGVNADFARSLYAALGPGSTVIVTDEPLRPAGAEAQERVLLEAPEGDPAREAPVTPIPSPPSPPAQPEPRP